MMSYLTHRRAMKSREQKPIIITLKVITLLIIMVILVITVITILLLLLLLLEAVLQPSQRVTTQATHRKHSIETVAFGYGQFS